jgi:hypothetical protein
VALSFIHYTFKKARSTDAVRVLIDRAANVFLVDDEGLAAFKAGQKFNYWGGRSGMGEKIIKIPRAGNWHLVIDLAGDGGTIRHSAVLIHGA